MYTYCSKAGAKVVMQVPSLQVVQQNITPEVARVKLG